MFIKIFQWGQSKRALRYYKWENRKFIFLYINSFYLIWYLISYLLISLCKNIKYIYQYISVRYFIISLKNDKCQYTKLQLYFENPWRYVQLLILNVEVLKIFVEVLYNLNEELNLNDGVLQMFNEKINLNNGVLQIFNEKINLNNGVLQIFNEKINLNDYIMQKRRNKINWSNCIPILYLLLNTMNASIYK